MNSIKFIFVKFQLKIIKYLWSHWINTYSIEIIIIHHLQPNLFDGNKSFEFSDRGAVLLLILFLSFAFEMLVARHWMAVTWSISDNHKSLSLWIFAHVLSTRVVTPAQHLTSTILLPLAISYKYKLEITVFLIFDFQIAKLRLNPDFKSRLLDWAWGFKYQLKVRSDKVR